MRNEPSSSGILFTAFGFFVIFSLKHNEFQQHILIVEQKLLKGWTVLFWLFKDRFENLVNLIVQNVVVVEWLKKFY